MFISTSAVWDTCKVQIIINRYSQNLNTLRNDLMWKHNNKFHRNSDVIFGAGMLIMTQSPKHIFV